ncbi:MAG: hypothetical protein AAB461_01245, partial [Patescibacteria group bacterium]
NTDILDETMYHPFPLLVRGSCWNALSMISYTMSLGSRFAMKFPFLIVKKHYGYAIDITLSNHI